MQFPMLGLLKNISKCREISLHDVVKLMPIRHNDHRDFYPIAVLFQEGYLSTNIKEVDVPSKTNEIAKLLYAMYLEERDVKKDGIASITGVGWKDKLVFGCGAKTYTYLSERREKWVDRAVSLSIGIVIAVFAATTTVYLQDKLSHNNSLKPTAYVAGAPPASV